MIEVHDYFYYYHIIISIGFWFLFFQHHGWRLKKCNHCCKTMWRSGNGTIQINGDISHYDCWRDKSQ